MTVEEWLVLVEAFAGLEPWMDLLDEADLLRAEVALVAMQPQPPTGQSFDRGNSFVVRLAAGLERFIAYPALRMGNETVTYEVAREMVVRARLIWIERPSEIDEWESLADQIVRGGANRADIVRWLSARVSSQEAA
jgi:hypothetical protein